MANSKAKIGAVIIITTIFWILQQQWLQASYDYANISFLDVGQGDAIYIHTVSNMDVLIDGGPDDQVVSQIGQVMPFWDRSIELVILSHPDADHVSGLAPLLEYYDIEKIMLVDLPIKSAVHEEFYKRLEANGTEIIHAFSGNTFQLSDKENLRILHPFANEDLTKKETNDTAIVAEYIFSGKEATRILLTGDISKEVEEDLLQKNLIEDVDILKVAHHGSHSSSMPEFITAAMPEYSVIQSGADNSYGHPHADILERLQAQSTVLRNDQLGTITFRVDDHGYVLQE